MSNLNIAEKAKQKVQRSAANGVKPTKDSFGNNIKKHFGVWKYFVAKSDGVRQKCYISNECRRLDERSGLQ